MKFETIIVEKEEGLGKIIFNRPDVLNAYNETLAGEILKAFNALAKDESVRVIVFTGSGRAFMAGADIKMVNAWAEQGDPSKINAHLSSLLNPNMLEDCPKPVIAAVNGIAFGMGFEIALACDYRIAIKKAKFALPEVKLGLVPGGGGSQRLFHIVGAARALEMISFGDPIDATEAHRIGLINVLADDEAGLREAVERFAQGLIVQSTSALATCKRLIYEGGALPIRKGIEYEKQQFCEILLTEDAREGTQAFLDKRQPQFKGK
ncbi:3-hydroxybutyryl-CoA dehydratase [Desulfosarcina widdelii]|uniref:3-hydroxybutyryl-CoA dehydratase n=1 Tax=Desulfosarcina widdelii TaxID=947919 RepID=A0A5K7Z8D2_9BACT|nr:enoyl-CoA hydratase-related protein [Desulfosarcina widdelii]BBO75951.1 3-hydroxybutyryl-CoA dehydratase [Desulfosarcina widdelii]